MDVLNKKSTELLDLVKQKNSGEVGLQGLEDGGTSHGSKDGKVKSLNDDLKAFGYSNKDQNDYDFMQGAKFTEISEGFAKAFYI